MILSCRQATPARTHRMDLERIVNDIAHALKLIDSSAVPFKNYQAGVGPYSEPQLLKARSFATQNK